MAVAKFREIFDGKSHHRRNIEAGKLSWPEPIMVLANAACLVETIIFAEAAP